MKKKEVKLLEAAEYLKQGSETINSISKLTGIKKNEVINLQTRMMKNESQIIPSKKDSKRKLKSEHIEFIKSLIEGDGGAYLTLKDLKQELLTNFSNLDSINVSTIGRLLKRIGYSYRKISSYPDKRNTNDVKNSRIKVSKKIAYALHQNLKVIFIDETSIHLGLGPHYGWGKKGKKLSAPVPPKSENYTVIAAITPSQVLGCQVAKGGIKAGDFIGFLCTLVTEYRMDVEPGELVIFVDNATSHKANAVKIKMNGKLTILYNAEYSPMLNPIEEFFSKFKKMLRKNPTETESNLIQSIRNVLCVFEQRELKSYTRHMLSFAKESLTYVDFYWCVLIKL